MTLESKDKESQKTNSETDQNRCSDYLRFSEEKLQFLQTLWINVKTFNKNFIHFLLWNSNEHAVTCEKQSSNNFVQIPRIFNMLIKKGFKSIIWEYSLIS